MANEFIFLIVWVVCLTIIICFSLFVKKGDSSREKGDKSKEHLYIHSTETPYKDKRFSFNVKLDKHMDMCRNPLYTGHYINVVYMFGNKKVIATINIGIVNFYEEQDDKSLVLIKDIDQYLRDLSIKHTEFVMGV